MENTQKEAGFTPGPWIIREFAGTFNITTSTPPRTFNIARANPERAEYEANARLIAAAPELLEALTRIADLASLQPRDPRNKANVETAKAIACAAIAKATGKDGQ